MYKSYDIGKRGVPLLVDGDLLKTKFEKLATKEYYNALSANERDGKIDPYSALGDSVKMRPNHSSDQKEISRLLKRCFPNITFRLSGFFIYGPGDYMSEHTNSNDPGNTMYITYATGESSFSYRFDPSEEFVKTSDMKNDITLRTFSLTGEGPFTHHKVDCESGYRLSIGMRYVQIK